MLAQLRVGSGLTWEQFARRVSQSGFRVSSESVQSYEEGRTKKIPLDYVEAVCRAFGAAPTAFFSPDLPGAFTQTGEAERKLSAIREIVSGSDGPIANQFVAPHDPESLRRRFLASIHDYSDLEVERICGLNHETVRQYRQGQWPKRGPNASTEGKMERFLELHEQRRTAAATDHGELPPLVEGLISFAEEWERDQDFRDRYPRLGWISIAEDAMLKLRSLGLVRYDDEIAWLAYKRGTRYDPETCDDVGLEDLGLSVEPFVQGGAPL